MRKDIGCLIIHGYGGSIEEVAPLSDFLSNRGFGVVCPELKGHTGKRKDLSGIKYTEWIESAEEKLRELQSSFSNIILIGFSMGGLIAVNLALKYKIDGLITLNMPIYYWDFKRILLNISEDIYNKKPFNTARYIKSSLDKPLSSLVNFKMLLEKTKPLIKEVKCPIFIAQALEDDTVQKRSAEYIYKNISSQNKFLKYFNGSGHLICLSSVCDKVFNDIAEFINCIIEK